jgi:hypothetical protein
MVVNLKRPQKELSYPSCLPSCTHLIRSQKFCVGISEYTYPELPPPEYLGKCKQKSRKDILRSSSFSTLVLIRLK